ncbi:MAG: hypothetical protein WA555_15970 [Candidatus Sulfotelmatobacter sp.]
MGNDSHQDVTIRELIEFQRRFARSRDIFEQVVGTLFVAGVLQKRLMGLTDRQIGQLLSDVVDGQLAISEPEVTICKQATVRLARSGAGQLTTRGIEHRKGRAVCPKCSNEMLLQYGIEEPDYLECVLTSCSHRIPA